MENHKIIMLMADECIKEVTSTVRKGQDDIIKAQFITNNNKIISLMKDVKYIIDHYMTYTTEIKEELENHLNIYQTVQESEMKVIRAIEQCDNVLLSNLKNIEQNNVHNIMIEMIELVVYIQNENIKQMKRDIIYIERELQRQEQSNESKQKETDDIIIQKLRDLKNKAWENFVQTREELRKEPLHIQTEREHELEILYRETEMTKERLQHYIYKIEQEHEIKKYNGFIDFSC